MGAGAAAAVMADPCVIASPKGTAPLAQRFTVAARVPNLEHYIHDPGMTILPSGKLLVAAPCWHFHSDRRYLLMSRSSDGGRTWEPLDPLPYADATPFVVNGRLYMFVQRRNWQDVAFTSSEDEGKTWAQPSTIFKGRLWNCSTSMAVKNNCLYWAVSAVHWHSQAALAADLTKDLMNPAAWRISDYLARPVTPPLLTRKLYPAEQKKLKIMWGYDNWLEPNVVVVNGHVRVFSRTVTDEYATANLGTVCDIEDDGKKLELKFTQFYPLPGGQNKFFILYDQTSRYFWMLSVLAADSQDYFHQYEKIVKSGYHGAPGNERRHLFLFYSLDSLNWFPAGPVATWPGMLQAFMYPSAAIDGQDIVLVSRTARYSRNQHDADHCTFHRIRNFRSLAIDIRPDKDAFERRNPAPNDELALHSDKSRTRLIEGRWMWHDGSHVIVKADGSVANRPGMVWRRTGPSQDTFEFSWTGDGEEKVAKFTLSVDGKILEGPSIGGSQVWAVRTAR